MLNYNFAPTRYLDMDCSKFSEFLLQHFDDAVIILSSKMITASGKVFIFILPDEGDHNNNQNIAIKYWKTLSSACPNIEQVWLQTSATMTLKSY